MEPRLVFLIPIIVSLVVAVSTVSMYNSHSSGGATATQATHMVAVSTHTVPKAVHAATPATSAKHGGMDSVSKALSEVSKRGGGVGLEELVQRVSRNIGSIASTDKSAAPGSAGFCEVRIGSWYGNNTHVCWQGVCALVTPFHRYVFYAVAAQLRSSVELLRGFNETFGCVITPGYTEKALETAERIEELAKGNITGCSYVEMIMLLKSFQAYVESHEALWEKLSMGCAEKRHDTEQVKELLAWLSTRTDEMMEWMRVLSEKTREGVQETKSIIDEWLRKVQANITSTMEKVNGSLERSASSLQEALRRLSGNAEAAGEQPGEIVNTINASNSELTWKMQDVAGQLEGLQEELEKLREGLSKLGQQLQVNVTLNITLPGRG